MEQKWVLNILHVYWTDFDRSYLEIIITLYLILISYQYYVLLSIS